MKVLFDYQAFSMQNYGGISRYFANLYYGLNTGTETEPKLGLLFTDNAYINNEELPAGIFNKAITKKSRRDKYNKWYNRYLLQQGSFDVFHPTYYNPYFLKSIKKPFVLTVHDMIHELYPQYFAKDPFTQGYKNEVINRADHIIAISQCTKNDIQKFYNIDESKISVVHHGYKMQASDVTSGDIGVDGEYVLYVGDREGYKNFQLFIKAIVPVVAKYAVKVICAGGGSFKADEVKYLDELNLVNIVRQLTVTDSQLKQLYQHATAFVYPSLYEGFGLPVLEAFFNNCPVIMSNTSSFLEVGSRAAEYFDPANEESIAFAIEKVLSNNSLQNELKLKGKERLKLFSFESCLQNTQLVYSALT